MLNVQLALPTLQMSLTIIFFLEMIYQEIFQWLESSFIPCETHVLHLILWNLRLLNSIKIHQKSPTHDYLQHSLKSAPLADF